MAVPAALNPAAAIYTVDPRHRRTAAPLSANKLWPDKPFLGYGLYLRLLGLRVWSFVAGEALIVYKANV